MNQVFGDGVAKLRTEPICAYVVFNHFGHQTVQCTPHTCDDLEYVAAPIAFLNLAFHSIDLAKDSPCPIEPFCPLSTRFRHA
jgi:hypothetical protein